MTVMTDSMGYNTYVFYDPTGNSGDSGNQIQPYAVAVTGDLVDVTGIAAYGIAVYDQATFTWVQVDSGGGGAYASLTGPGETATPGALTQLGDFTVNDSAGVGGIYLLSLGLASTTNGGISIEDQSGEGILIYTDIGTGTNANGIQIYDTIATGSSGIQMYCTGDGDVQVYCATGDVNMGSTNGSIFIYNVAGGPTQQLSISNIGESGLNIHDTSAVNNAGIHVLSFYNKVVISSGGSANGAFVQVGGSVTDQLNFYNSGSAGTGITQASAATVTASLSALSTWLQDIGLCGP